MGIPFYFGDGRLAVTADIERQMDTDTNFLGNLYKGVIYAVTSVAIGAVVTTERFPAHSVGKT